MNSAEKFKYTLFIRFFGITKIPLIFFVRPSIYDVNEKSVIIKIPFRRRTKNHLKSMYFGAMSIGADLAAGYLAFRKIHEKNLSISLIFKNFQADFLKRAEDHTYFSCHDGEKINNLIKKATDSMERVEDEIQVVATVPNQFGDEPVAQFRLTLSLKMRDNDY